MERCAISLGGNQGPVSRTFNLAFARLLDSGCNIVAVSQFLTTRPVGDSSGDPFLNAAAILDTGHSPVELLKLLHVIEAEAGRTRDRHWGPRTLDLDLLLYGNRLIESSALTVPHPAAWYRRFVLDPLVEVAADCIHPTKLVTVRTLWQRLQVLPLQLALAGGTKPDREQLIQALEPEFPQVEFGSWPESPKAPETTHASVPPVYEPTFIVWMGTVESTSDTASTPGSPRALNPMSFEGLPLVPRVNATREPGSALVFVRNLLRSALG